MEHQHVTWPVRGESVAGVGVAIGVLLVGVLLVQPEDGLVAPGGRPERQGLRGELLTLT